MKALIIDDDRVLSDVVAFTLRRAGFETVQIYDGKTALDRWEAEQPDLIVLDVNLPQFDGFTICRRIREQATTPILMLTVRDQEDDIVRGLGLGADDYITKPFSPRQLVARAQAVLRRMGQAPVPAVRRVGRLTLDPSRRELCIDPGEPVALTALETRLLDYFILNAGHILTADAIIAHVWGPESADRDMLRQLVRRLRAKIAQAAGDLNPSDYIETVPGLGYGLSIAPASD
ncbi:MAG: response regulator transcription factor [Chloroflexi bacterium]|nr:response regulator transcription factor [Chloroflexota bacterium]MBU1749063.1 response regulator transcription factor [Chloroflexota bacterium]